MAEMISKWIKNLFSGNSWTMEDEYVPDYYVVAGDPVCASAPVISKNEVKAALVKFAGEDRGFLVSGNSMVPKDIYSGDALICKAYAPEETLQVNNGDFLIIKVDSEYYKAENKKAKFKYKLRYAVCAVNSGEDFDSLLEKASEIEDSLLLDNNVKELRVKFNKARDFYGDEELILSITYHDGHTGYSFHPRRMIEFVVESVGKPNGIGGWIKETA